MCNDVSIYTISCYYILNFTGVNGSQVESDNIWHTRSNLLTISFSIRVLIGTKYVGICGTTCSIFLAYSDRYKKRGWFFTLSGDVLWFLKNILKLCSHVELLNEKNIDENFHEEQRLNNWKTFWEINEGRERITVQGKYSSMSTKYLIFKHQSQERCFVRFSSFYFLYYQLLKSITSFETWWTNTKINFICCWLIF